MTSIADVDFECLVRVPTGLEELDLVLGGGLVPGSVVLIGGDPGIGKSMALSQTLCHLVEHRPALYVTGEESLQQVSMRARRLELLDKNLKLLAQTCVEHIIAVARVEKPFIV